MKALLQVKKQQRSIESNSKADYREKLEEELKELRESELWQAGKTVRSLRPENQAAPAAEARRKQMVRKREESVTAMKIVILEACRHQY